MILDKLDWFIIVIYLSLLLSLSFYLSKFQKTKRDYFISNRNENSFFLAVSVIATQCSTSSILGAPAFVAFSAGGGLVWLQYELALPLSMIIIMIFLFPIFYKLKLISVYEYLEKRFDLKTRLLLSGLFQLVRAFATAVTVYGISIIVELVSGLNFFWSVLILGLITVIYDFLGGIKAIVYSDVLQMTILTIVLMFIFFYFINTFGSLDSMINYIPTERLATLNFSQHGFGDGADFAFWPMLIGGTFLYISYYGCDQSQVQREFCARSQNDGQKVFFYNGLLRFPLVFLYCFIGVGLAAYAQVNTEFIKDIPLVNNQPNYNLVLPIFLIQNLPVGIVGLTLVALFSAAMSSIDSVINSLSATTMEDFLKRFNKQKWSLKKELLLSRIITLFWGIILIFLTFHVEDISTNVLVAINKVSSLINGPVLGVFIVGLINNKANGTNICISFSLGIAVNIVCWIFFKEISWLWWNVIGFLVCFVFSTIFNIFLPTKKNTKKFNWSFLYLKSIGLNKTWIIRYVSLFFYFILIFSLLYKINN
tara:strand:+ start:1673 stop:3280 length:1608 start_codon:yes stop_codon:yes gene_type:complete